MSEKKIEATAYLQVRATERRGPKRRATEVRITRATQNMPAITDPDVRLVRVRLSLPPEAFDPLGIMIDVPEGAVIVPEIEGEVEIDEH